MQCHCAARDRRLPVVLRRLLAGWGLLLLALAGCAEFDYAADRASRELGVSAGTPATYTVREGDTLYQIAFAAGLDFREVARWNGIDAPYVIYPGQRLRLRPPSGQSRRSRTAAADPQSRPDSEPAPASERAPTPDRDDPDRWQWPLEGRVVRQYDANAAGKQGIGIAAEPGSPVSASASGNIVYSGSGLPGYGNLVIIKHNERFLTAYGYNRELLVEEGDSVNRGETIARVGASDEHPGELHFELRERGQPVDPTAYLP
ncbi:peptidoglycan DD-metalloendopeptidase family protein [Spiribacter vilamensis]|uniref:peptidoglycan DD-metalloendopeptidase family protein n=1 Tax=Spiribacter vilamensis TaxID=531306 RepID=UPI00102BF518|nr:peptidoglycan DD-metalloendopeptidase family protein [Spiribacter vilamensis]TVO60655.1 peptidoglycan DD-metalloendopeptidase family protein [Spiribacter vilamensis]